MIKTKVGLAQRLRSWLYGKLLNDDLSREDQILLVLSPLTNKDYLRYEPTKHDQEHLRRLQHQSLVIKIDTGTWCTTPAGDYYAQIIKGNHP